MKWIKLKRKDFQEGEALFGGMYENFFHYAVLNVVEEDGVFYFENLPCFKPTHWTPLEPPKGYGK